jgi:hypothetical protein
MSGPAAMIALGSDPTGMVCTIAVVPGSIR